MSLDNCHHRFQSPCILVAIEGLDGVGKTTTVAGLSRMLKTQGYAVEVRHLEKSYLRHAFNIARRSKDPRIKYLLQAAATSLLAEEISTLSRSVILLCDRYFLSARAYYMALTGAPDLVPEALTFLPVPNIAVLLECRPHIRRERLLMAKRQPSVRKLNTTDEAFSLRMHKILLDSYSWIRIDNQELSPRQTIEQVYKLIERSLHEKV